MYTCKRFKPSKLAVTILLIGLALGVLGITRTLLAAKPVKPTFDVTLYLWVEKPGEGLTSYKIHGTASGKLLAPNFRHEDEPITLYAPSTSDVTVLEPDMISGGPKEQMMLHLYDADGKPYGTDYIKYTVEEVVSETAGDVLFMRVPVPNPAEAEVHISRGRDRGTVIGTVIVGNIEYTPQ